MVVLLLFFFDGLDDFLFVGLLDNFFDTFGMDDVDVVDDSKTFVVSATLALFGGVKVVDVVIPVLGVIPPPPPPLEDDNVELSSGVVIIETLGVDTSVGAAGGGGPASVVMFEVLTVIADADTPPPPLLSPLVDAKMTLSLILLLTLVAEVVAEAAVGTSTTVPSGANATGPEGRSANGSSSPVLNPPIVGVRG